MSVAVVRGGGGVRQYLGQDSPGRHGCAEKQRLQTIGRGLMDGEDLCRGFSNCHLASLALSKGARTRCARSAVGWALDHTIARRTKRRTSWIGYISSSQKISPRSDAIQQSEHWYRMCIMFVCTVNALRFNVNTS